MTDGKISETRILAVDDEAIWRLILDEELTELGVDHEVVGSLSEATEHLEAEGFCGVITDGLEGSWRRVSELADAAGAWVVVISGDEATVNLARLQGCSAFGKATFDSADFQRTIQSLV